MVQVVLELAQRLEQQFETVKRQEIREHRHEQVVGRHQRVEVQQPKRGRGVHNDELVAVQHPGEGPLELVLAPGHRHERDVDGRHPQVGREHIELHERCPHDHVCDRYSVDQGIEDGALEALGG